MKRIIFSLAILAMGMKLQAQTPISCYPLNQAKDINIDTHLIIEFDSEVKAGNKGIISIIDKTTRKVVDRIDMSIPAGPTDGQPKNPAAIYTPVPYIYIRWETSPTVTLALAFLLESPRRISASIRRPS